MVAIFLLCSLAIDVVCHHSYPWWYWPATTGAIFAGVFVRGWLRQRYPR